MQQPPFLRKHPAHPGRICYGFLVSISLVGPLGRVLAGLQVLQGKVWVWGRGRVCAEEDSRLVKLALIAELADQWPPHGHDGQPWDIFGAPYMRDLPYGPPKHLLLHLLYLGACHQHHHTVPVAACASAQILFQSAIFYAYAVKGIAGNEAAKEPFVGALYADSPVIWSPWSRDILRRLGHPC